MEEPNKKILVVDDEADVRNYLSTALADAGFIVETAVNGFDALKKINSFEPDLISLDLVMPEHSGLKFYREIQKNKKWNKIPVLIVTGHARDDLGKVDFDTMIMQGPGVYLEKPVKPENYIKTVCSLLKLDESRYLDKLKGNDPDKLRDELNRSLLDADRETLQKALDALKKISNNNK